MRVMMRMLAAKSKTEKPKNRHIQKKTKNSNIQKKPKTDTFRKSPKKPHKKEKP